jgi:alginate O-acetyltransferase complex protein AlgI
MFVTYFPELIAGPIVRASVFLPQMARSLRPSIQRAQIGMQLILLGVTKKLVFADRLAIFVDPVFAQPKTYSPSTVMLAVVAYSIQVYCDFSGYSDMAIGISKIIGFDLPENFNMPFLACSITEFWRRWHITLSQWLRDYVYVSLGGNRRGRVRTYVNLFITMLLGGLWHGAKWTFVFFGCLHGIALAVHKMWLESRPRTGPPSLAGRLLSWAATYSFFCFSLIVFRSTSFSNAWIAVRKVFWLDNTGITWTYTPLLLLVPLLITGHILGIVAAAQMGRDSIYGGPPDLWAFLYRGAAKRRFALKPHRAAGTYVLLPLHNFVGVFCLISWPALVFIFASVKTNPFIYFQF